MLATYGLDQHGHIYVHVKIYKQHRIFGEILVTEGRVQLHCRECLRWHTVIIQSGTAALRQEASPPAVVEESAPDPTLEPIAPRT